MTGNVVPKPASLEASLTYLESVTEGDDKYHVKAAYGDDLGVDLAGKWQVNLENKGDKKWVIVHSNRFPDRYGWATNDMAIIL